jgi:hypothetical protein
LLRGIIESEDAADCRRAELALAIFLLSRNYDLVPGDYRDILGFAPGDPALGEMQRSIHDLAIDQIRALRQDPDSDPNSSGLPKTHWRIFNLLKLRNRSGSGRSPWLK